MVTNQTANVARMEFSHVRNGITINEGYEEIRGHIHHVYQVNHLTKQVIEYITNLETNEVSQKRFPNPFKYFFVSRKLRKQKELANIR